MEDRSCVKRTTCEKVLCSLLGVLLCVTLVLVGLVIFFATKDNTTVGMYLNTVELKTISRTLISCFPRYFKVKFASDLRQVGGFLRVLRFPPPIKLNAMI